MDIMQQLELTFLHLEGSIGKMHDIGDVYLAVLSPAVLKTTPISDNTIIYSQTGDRENGTNYYENNKGLDANGNGAITKGEAYAPVIKRRDEILKDIKGSTV